MQKITPCLWFNGNAEEAATYYMSIFQNSKIVHVTFYGDESPDKQDQVMYMVFQLEGQDFIALNGGAEFTFNPAVSFYVSCESQTEVDELWEKLSQGGEKQPCGWLRDRYGISWQIVPSALGELLDNGDSETRGRVMKAMLEMDKINISVLQQAYNHI